MGCGLDSYASGHLVDLSVSGLRFAARQAVDVGAEICLGLLLEGARGAPIISAVVRWCEATDAGFSHGLEFVSVGTAERHALAQLAGSLPGGVVAC